MLGILLLPQCFRSVKKLRSLENVHGHCTAPRVAEGLVNSHPWSSNSELPSFLSVVSITLGVQIVSCFPEENTEVNQDLFFFQSP